MILSSQPLFPSVKWGGSENQREKKVQKHTEMLEMVQHKTAASESSHWRDSTLVLSVPCPFCVWVGGVYRAGTKSVILKWVWKRCFQLRSRGTGWFEVASLELRSPYWSFVSNEGDRLFFLGGGLLSSFKLIMGSIICECFFTQEVFTKCLLLTQKVYTKCLLFI